MRNLCVRFLRTYLIRQTWIPFFLFSSTFWVFMVVKELNVFRLHNLVTCDCAYVSYWFWKNVTINSRESDRKWRSATYLTHNTTQLTYFDRAIYTVLHILLAPSSVTATVHARWTNQPQRAIAITIIISHGITVGFKILFKSLKINLSFLSRFRWYN